METNLIVGAQKLVRKLVISLTAETECHMREKYVGSVKPQKLVNNVAIHKDLKGAWSKYEPMSITNLKDNVILIEFDKEEEKIVILDQQPWSIKGCCLNLKKWEHTKPERYRF